MTWLWNILNTTDSYAGWNGCVDYSKITKKLRFVDQVVMELWYR